MGGAVFGALLTAFLQPYFEGKRKPKATLAATVSHHSYASPSKIKSSIDEYIYSQAYRVKLKEDFKEILRGSALYSGYTVLIIRNNSQKTIHDISVNLNNLRNIIYEIEKDSKTLQTSVSNICEVGSLKPHTECLVRFWHYDDITKSYLWNDKKSLSITANEIDFVEINYPLPKYLEEKFIQKPSRLTQKIKTNFLYVLIIIYLFIIAFEIFRSSQS